MDQDLKLELWQFRRDVVSASQDIAAKMQPILLVGIAEPAAIYYHPDGSSGLLALAEALAILTTPVIEQLCALGVQVDQLTNLIANPEATRADELYRRAVKAFSFEWLEESANDARLALDADPYHFGAYYLLGRIAIREQQPAAASTSFAKAARYAAPSQPKLAATAALAGMHCYRGPGGDPAAAAKLGASTVAAMKACSPQLLLATARLTGDANYATKALVADPSVLPIALATDLPGLEVACQQAVEPLVTRQEHLAALLDTLNKDYLRPIEARLRSTNFNPPLPPCPFCGSSGKTGLCSQYRLCSDCKRPFKYSIADSRRQWAYCNDLTASFGKPVEGSSQPGGEALTLHISYEDAIARVASAAKRSATRIVPSVSPIATFGALAAVELELFTAWCLAMGCVSWAGDTYNPNLPPQLATIRGEFWGRLPAHEREGKEILPTFISVV